MKIRNTSNVVKPKSNSNVSTTEQLKEYPVNILITGVTGFIGFHLARTLSAQGHHITAAVRDPATWQTKLPAYRWIHCDFRQDLHANDWTPRLTGIDIIINTVGIIHEQHPGDFDTIQTQAPIALFDAAATHNIKILQISAIGADIEGVQEAFLSSKRKTDQHLLQLPTDAIVIYPAIVIGRGGTSTALFNQMAASPLIPLIGNGQQKLQPLHIDDLCLQIAYLIRQWPTGKTVLTLVGPQTLTLRELYNTLRDWLRLPPAHFLPLPLGLLRPLAHLSTRLGIRSFLTPESLDLLEKSRIYPSSDKAPPARPLADALWADPATHADTWHARLMLLRPLLVASLAFVWFFTAFTSAFFDVDSGYALLKAGGIEGWLATLSIYAGAGIDLALGVGMLLPERRLLAMKLQVALMLGYSVIISFLIPAQWLHPFGPVTKNFPMIAATLLLIATDPKSALKFVKGV